MRCFSHLFGSLFVFSLLSPISCKQTALTYSNHTFIKRILIFPIKGFDYYYNKLYCTFYECCQAPYLQFNLAKLEKNINNNLFGQPLVKNTLYSALKGHFELQNPKKALVLSFHGSTGVGQLFGVQILFSNVFLLIYNRSNDLIKERIMSLSLLAILYTKRVIRASILKCSLNSYQTTQYPWTTYKLYYEIEFLFIFHIH